MRRHSIQISKSLLRSTVSRIIIQTIKVQPGREPQAFIKAWNGNLRFTISSPENLPKLYLILGNSAQDCHLVQVPFEKSSLRQNSTFVLVDEKQKKFNFLVPKESFGNEEIMNVLLPDFAARGFSGKIYKNFNIDLDDKLQGAGL